MFGYCGCKGRQKNRFHTNTFLIIKRLLCLVIVDAKVDKKIVPNKSIKMQIWINVVFTRIHSF